MKKKGLAGIVLFAVFCLFAVNGFASGGHGHKGPKKVGILLVAFGSSEDSAQISFENIDKKVASAYPNIPVRWADTSHINRAKYGRQLDSPAEALAKYRMRSLPMRPFSPCIPSAVRNTMICDIPWGL